MSHAGQFWLSGFQIASDLARIGDLSASGRPVARTDYASGLMAAKNVAKPVTETRGRGSTVWSAGFFHLSGLESYLLKPVGKELLKTPGFVTDVRRGALFL